MNQMHEKLCSMCGTPTGLMCKRCGEPYCNVGCQENDWQRHKYFCIIMPPLVTYRELKSPLAEKSSAIDKPIQSISPGKDSVETETTVPIPTSIVPFSPRNLETSELSKAWREHYLPRDTDFFECRVTFMEADGPFWVVDGANVESMERLTDLMMRSHQSQKLGRAKSVLSDTLVGICVDHKIHRGHVLDIDESAHLAEIRMIDYGATVTTPFSDIYEALPKMAECKAFAFRVKPPTNTGVQLNKNLTIRLLGTRRRDGVYQVHVKPKMTIPLNLPVEMLQQHPGVKVIRTFVNNASLDGPLVALVQIKVMEHINADLNASLKSKPGHRFTGPFPEEKCTFFVAARTKNGYRRAFLLDHLEKPQPTYLVYEMDEGRVSVTTELSRIPGELLGLPIRVFAINLTDSASQLLKKIELAESNGEETLAVKFKLDIPFNKDRLRSANASLMLKGEEVCLVRLITFLGQVSDLGYKFWHEPINNGDSVFISQVLSYKELYISSSNTKSYKNYFNRMETKCKPFKDSASIPVGCIVLVVCPKQGHFRGVVASIRDDTFTVANIDTGASHQVEFGMLRMSCRFLENLPVSVMRVKLKTVGDVPEGVVPAENGAINLLHLLSAQQEEFRLDINVDNSTIDLLSSSGPESSLVGRILPLMFTSRDALTPVPSPAASPERIKIQSPVLLEPAVASLPPSPPDSPSTAFTGNSRQLMELSVGKPNENQPHFERYYYNDLPKQLVPLGDNLEIIVLNAQDMPQTGYLTACYFPNVKVAENFQSLLTLVARHGECSHNFVEGYVPGVGELCLALFSGDDGWYRGVCLEVKDQSIKILYCDFGNMAYVPLDDIKPIPNDMLLGIYATKCYIEGFHKTKNFGALEELLVRISKIACNVKNGPERDTRLLTFANLDDILGGKVL
ncbi:hypothetical protein KR009_006674 [Drosophila setifemur]|nr:hypothetical protein KR009_006674 [Drosophila setifemur]